MKIFPCAKINLGLHVTERRADGYHNLETVFYPIPLCDELEATPLKGGEQTADRLVVEGIPVAGDTADNLVMRALRSLRQAGYHVPPLSLRLQKHIPSGAGLGGGSSDAAAAMKLAREMFQLAISDEEMEKLLAPLGADCPFFVRQRPVLATGIGNVFSPIGLDLSGWWIVVVKPSDFVSTREAYQGVTPCLPPRPLAEVVAEPIDTWQQSLVNDFERSVFPLHPTVADIKQRLLDSGATYAAMSGSGSSVFGLFHEEPSPALLQCFAPHFVFAGAL